MHIYVPVASHVLARVMIAMPNLTRSRPSWGLLRCKQYQRFGGMSDIEVGGPSGHDRVSPRHLPMRILMPLQVVGDSANAGLPNAPPIFP